MVTASDVAVVLPKSVVDKLKKEAEKAGLRLEEYVLDLVLRDFDPRERAEEYVKVAENLLEQAKDELERGEVRQAAEKLWGAAALAVKAYAEFLEGRRPASHGELWEYARKMAREMGLWVREAWMYANGMHVCFYEGWCGEEDVEDSLNRIRTLVRKVKENIVGKE